jgi:transcriptional regulator with XRE-family HTH domain
MDDASTTGARLRTLRKWRGMTLVQLGGQAGLSASFLSMVERGVRTLDRRSHIAAIAAALRVSEADLAGGPHLSADPVQSGPHAGVPALRVALHTNSLHSPVIERARPLSELVREMAEVELLRREYDFIAIASRLPDILDELHLHASQPEDEAMHRTALETLIEACVVAYTVSKNLGYLDLAHVAALRATDAAAILNDPVQQGKAALIRILAMPRTGSWDRPFRAAEAAANALGSPAERPQAVDVLGMLTLNAALGAAVTHNGQAAEDWLIEAGRLAQRVPDDPDGNWQSFSMTNVGMWAVTVAVERGEAGGSVMERAEQVDPAKLTRTPPFRKAGFYADVGRGLAREKKSRDQAVRWLRRAEVTAPQWFRNSSSLRHTVEVMLTQSIASAGGRELRGMAARMGIPHRGSAH